MILCRPLYCNANLDEREHIYINQQNVLLIWLMMLFPTTRCEQLLKISPRVQSSFLLFFDMKGNAHKRNWLTELLYRNEQSGMH